MKHDHWSSLWVLGAGRWMWCYACGALRTPDSKGRLVWVRPTGRADRNPAASKPKLTLTPRRVALLLRHYALHAQMSPSWHETHFRMQSYLKHETHQVERWLSYENGVRNDIGSWAFASHVEQRMFLLLVAEAIASME